jgi:catecholate siderophore receptor
VPDYGVPYFQGRPLEVPVSRFYGLPDADYQRDQANVGTASYTHRFDARTSIRTALRRGSYSRDLWAVAPRLAPGTTSITDATPVNRQAQRRAGEEDILVSQTDFTTTLDAGGMKHLVLIGTELMNEQAERWNWGGGGANPPTTVGNPNASPLLPPNFFSVSRTGLVRYEADTLGFYAQDMIELARRWKLLLGARWDRFKADYDRAPPAGSLSRIDRVWSYRTGLIYQPSDFASYYVAYGTSFNPSGELYSLDDRGANTPPEKNRNIEAGAKWELFEGNLSLRTALFRTEKTNERNTDLAVVVEQNLLSGKRHTDGVEIEAAGRVTPNWDVFGGLAVMKGEIDAATGAQANTLGKKPINTPTYTFNLWTVYRLGGGWKLGGGIEGVGNRYANTTNTALVPHYVRVDALLGYERPRYDLKLNVLNVLNEDYYEGVYQGHVIPGTKRAVLLTARLKY